MADEPAKKTPESEEKPRHRAIVWALIAVASVLLVFSITANWVQRELLDTGQVESTTDEILTDEDVQVALSNYTVDQLYANVDVQGQIEERLPDPAKALAAPVAAAARQLALDAEQKALTSPEVQALVESAVARAHEQFVSLIEDESEYVSTTGGEVVLDYGSVVADLAARIGVDPETITQIQNLVQEYAQKLETGLPGVLSEIRSMRAAIADAGEGELSPEAQAKLETLQRTATEAKRKVAGVKKALAGAEDKVPSALQGRFGDLEDRLSDLEARLSEVADRSAAVLANPEKANTEDLDASLAALEERLTTLLARPALQTPGQLVLMDSAQLDGVQSLVSALRNLGFVLPLLALALYVAAIFLARGWRSRALVASGVGIVVATLLVLFAVRVVGNDVASSLASSETVEPAVESVYDTLSDGLRERARFILVVGLAFVGAGLLAGPGRAGTAARRWLAPYLHEHPALVYSVVAVIFLLWLAFLPGIENFGQILAIVFLGALTVVGTEALRRQTAREFPRRPGGS